MRSLLCGLLALLLAQPAAAQADRPIRHAGIELGGSGVKATVIELGPGGVHTRLFSQSRKTGLSVLADGAFRKEAIQETVAAIAEFHRIIRDAHKVPPERIIVVGSSGVPAATNRAALVEAVRKATGQTMRFIDERTEVALTIAGIVPRLEWLTALSLDIGSGNTKGGYLSADGTLVFASIPLGTVTFTQRVRAEMTARGQPFAGAAAALREAALLTPLRKGAAAMPDLSRRKRVYLSGGLVWAMVSLERPEAIDRAYVTFTAAEVAAFHKRVRAASGKYPVVDLKDVKDEARRKRAAREVDAVRKAYSAENLLAGAEILQALVTAFALDGKTLIFPRNAHVGWLGAYITGEKLQTRKDR